MDVERLSAIAVTQSALSTSVIFPKALAEIEIRASVLVPSLRRQYGGVMKASSPQAAIFDGNFNYTASLDSVAAPMNIVGTYSTSDSCAGDPDQTVTLTKQ